MLRKEHYSWVYVISVVIAVLASFVRLASITTMTTILAILGLVLGFANISRKESGSFLMGTVALIVAGIAAKGLENIVLIGTYVPGILTNLISLFAPAAIVVALKALNEAAKEK